MSLRLLYSFAVTVLLNYNLVYSQCETFDMTLTSQNPTCYNYSDGAIQINATGGNGGNDYSISDASGAVFSGFWGTSNILNWGWYYCTVIDDLGCVLYDSIYLENPPEIHPIVYFTDPSSLTACDGIAEVDTVLNYQGGYNGIAYFWDPGGPDGLGQNIKSDLCNEYFTLVVNDSFGCSVVAELSIGSAGVEDQSNSYSSIIYPNPFSEYTTLSIPSNYIGQSCKIYNQLGECVKSILVESEMTTIYFDDMPMGVYFFQIGDINGKMIYH